MRDIQRERERERERESRRHRDQPLKGIDVENTGTKNLEKLRDIVSIVKDIQG